MTGYYDYILGLIPLALLSIIGTLTVTGLQLTMVVPMAAGVAALLTDRTPLMNRPSSPSPSRLNERADPNAADAPFLLVLNAG